jgi:hypothetical protein
MTQYVDSQTGEYYEDNSTESTALTLQQQVGLGAFNPLVSQYGNMAYTLLNKKLADLNLGETESNIMLSKYKSGPMEDVERHLNKPMMIQGAIIEYKGPYKSKPGKDGTSDDMDGYFYMVLATDVMIDIDMTIGKRVLTFQRNLLLKTSSQEVVKYFFTKMESGNWFDFKKPIPCFFSGSKSTGFTVSTFSDAEYGTILAALREQGLK